MTMIPAHASEWDDIVGSMAGAATYHDRWYNQLSANMAGGEAFLLSYEKLPYRAAIPLIIHGQADKGKATSAYGYPGPLANSHDLPADFIADFQANCLDLLMEQGLSTVSSRLNPMSKTVSLIEGMGNVRHVGDTVMIDLGPSDEDRLRSYRRNHRQDISKTRKLSPRTYHDHDFTHINRFAEIYIENMKRVKSEDSYLFGIDYFNFIIDHLKDSTYLLITEISDNILCGGLFFCQNQIAYAHLVGFVSSVECKSPIKTLFDDACIFFRKLGYKGVFLGGGVGAKNDSLFHFKSGFGDITLPYHVWEWQSTC